MVAWTAVGLRPHWTITRLAGGTGIVVKVTNSGTDSFNYIRIQMVAPVHHTRGDDRPDRRLWAGPRRLHGQMRSSYAGIQPGQTYTVTIITDRPYPQNGGAQLFAGVGTSRTDFVLAGTATGPPDAFVVKCRCTSMTARILPSTLKVRDEYPKR